MDLLRAALFLVPCAVLYAGTWRATARFSPGTPAEQLLGATVLFLFVATLMLRVLGALTLLSVVPLAVAPLAIGAALLARFREVAPPSLGTPGPWRERGLRALGLAAIGAMFAALLAQAWLYRSTAWDAVWYHGLMTHTYVATASTAWLEVGVDFAQGYPNGVELLAAWPCAVLGTTTFDDVGQLPYAVAGVALVVAWAERVGTRRGTAIVLAAVWLAMPPVFLQLTANLADAAEAVVFASTLWYLGAAREGPARSWWVLFSASLAFACKGTALPLLAPLAPFLAWNQIRASLRGRPLVELPVRTALLVEVGLEKPIENYLHTGNPFWPIQARILGHALPGTLDPDSVRLFGMRSLNTFFFRGEGDFVRMLTSWYDLDPGYQPCLPSGGFGVVHAWLGVPAIVLAALALALGRWPRATRAPLAAALGLFVLALMGSSPWWPRFVLAASVASVAILGAVLGRMPRWADTFLSLGATVAAGVMLGVAVEAGVQSFHELGVLEVLALSPDERARVATGPLWPAEMARERDLRFGPDDALAYEAADWLIGQHVPWNYGSRLAWVEPDGAPEEYLARLHAARARWVILRTPHWQTVMRRLGARELFHHDGEIVFEVPPAESAGP